MLSWESSLGISLVKGQSGEWYGTQSRDSGGNNFDRAKLSIGEKMEFDEKRFGDKPVVRSGTIKEMGGEK